MRVLRKYYDDSQVVIGDAAGMATPLFGAGIDNILESIMVLSDVLDKALKSKNYSNKVLREYQERLEPVIGRELRKQALISKILITSMRFHQSLPTKLLSIIGFAGSFN